MTKLHSYKDSGSGCFANIRMDNGDPCFISVAQTGVRVRKSRLGFFGAKLYDKRVRTATRTAQALAGMYPRESPSMTRADPSMSAASECAQARPDGSFAI